MVNVGDTVYLIAHAYFHYVGRVTAILGVRRVALAEAVQVHSCDRSWTAFFKDGFKEDTRYDVVGTMPDVGYAVAIEFRHPVPNVGRSRGRL